MQTSLFLLPAFRVSGTQLCPYTSTYSSLGKPIPRESNNCRRMKLIVLYIVRFFEAGICIEPVRDQLEIQVTC